MGRRESHADLYIIIFLTPFIPSTLGGLRWPSGISPRIDSTLVWGSGPRERRLWQTLAANLSSLTLTLFFHHIKARWESMLTPHHTALYCLIVLSLLDCPVPHSSMSTHQVTSSIMSTPLPLLSSRGTPLIPQLLYDHLMHHRCPETAAIIARDMLQGPQVGQAPR